MWQKGNKVLKFFRYYAILFIIEWSKNNSIANPNGKYYIFVFDPTWFAKSALAGNKNIKESY